MTEAAIQKSGSEPDRIIGLKATTDSLSESTFRLCRSAQQIIYQASVISPWGLVDRFESPVIVRQGQSVYVECDSDTTVQLFYDDHIDTWSDSALQITVRSIV